MFDEETIRSNRSMAPVDLERETDEIVTEDTVMAPRKPHDADMIRGWGFSISADAAVRLLAEARKVGMAGVILIFLMVAGSVAGHAWGDPAVKGYLERQRADIEKDRALAATVEALVNDKKEEIRSDKILAEQMAELRREVQELKRSKSP